MVLHQGTLRAAARVLGTPEGELVSSSHRPTTWDVEVSRKQIDLKCSQQMCGRGPASHCADPPGCSMTQQQTASSKLSASHQHLQAPHR